MRRFITLEDALNSVYSTNLTTIFIRLTNLLMRRFITLVDALNSVYSTNLTTIFIRLTN